LLDYKLEYGNLVNVQITKDKTAMMKLGKFLTKSGYSEKQARDASSKLRAFTAMANGAVVQFTETGEQVVAVYASGPRSCMQGEESVRVYVGDDVSVAFVEIEDKIVARAVVNKKGMEYSAIYGNSEILAPLLEKAGFEEGDLDGCEIAAVYDGKVDAPVMPYVDGPDMATISSCGEFVTFDSNYGQLPCQSECGYLQEETKSCECCGHNVNEDDERWSDHLEQVMCSECYDEVHVHVGGETYHEDSDEIVQTYCDGYTLKDEAGYCSANDKWYPEDQIIYSEEMQDSYHESRVRSVIVNLEGEKDWILDDEITTTQDEDGCDVEVYDYILDEYDAHIEELKQEDI
jgi:hypothetical protein